MIMDISGMDPKDITVFTDGNIVRISGVRKRPRSGGDRNSSTPLENPGGPVPAL